LPAKLPTLLPLDIATADDAANFLSRSNPTTTDPSEKQCVETAIDRLSQRHLSSDIAVLLPYLSFKREPPPDEQKGFFLHASSQYSEYPAISALAREGEPARNVLLATIIQSDSQEVRRNATSALLLSYQGDDSRSPADGSQNRIRRESL
jgi:hypothetical protein